MITQTAAGYDFITDRNTNWDAPLWEANGSGDSLAVNVEVLVQGNIIPLQSSTYVTQRAPTNTFQTNMNWVREIVNSGKGLDGTTLQTWTFNASSDVNTANDTITLTGHGMDESMVIYLSDGGNTAPTGTANDTFYYAFPQDANTIKLCTVNEDTDAVSDYYYNGTTQRPIVDITGTGTGTITFTETRIINAGQSVLDILRPNAGSSSNIGPEPGNYIGDAGYNQNFIGTAQRFNSVFDATDETIVFRLQVNSSGRIDRVLMTLIDEDGDWINWYLYKKPQSPNSTGQLDYQFQPSEDSVKALKYQESGTFDHTRIRYLAIAAIGNNISSNRFGAINSSTSVLNLGGSFTATLGQDASLTDLVELAQTYTDSIKRPDGSDLQILSTIPIAVGDGSSDVSMVDSAKSLAFPPLADGINTFQNYLASLGVTINATALSNVQLTNSQIGASVPYSFDVIADSGANVDLSGNSYVFANASLDSDLTYDRQLFVGGEGVNDSGAEIRNSTFITNSQIGADNAMIEWDGNNDIESSSFALESGTTAGHGIRITATGTHDFTALSFSGFGADGSNTAAIYNDSGGAVTISRSGGTDFTIRNGAGASTTVTIPVNITAPNFLNGTRVKLINVTKANVLNNSLAGASGYSFTVNLASTLADIGDTIKIQATYQSGTTIKKPLEVLGVITASGVSFVNTQVDLPFASTLGVDGSTVSEFNLDGSNIEIDANDADGVSTKKRLVARYYYLITTADGIDRFFGAIKLEDAANAVIDRSITTLLVDNIGNRQLHFSDDDFRLYASDNSSWIKSQTTGGYGITDSSGKVYTTDLKAELDKINKNAKLIPALL